ncbi:TlpA disulfide reductase family protein [Pedobacter psychrodurus]|uniref:TlpA family protein disulfide reductase n=1 Tax=Pedobacter psychrodurus TaxID=2530456 RepID=UPI00292D1DC8|nr:TlpA disulfide reductase family protein [Pedobacter psychrodurus]
MKYLLFTFIMLQAFIAGANPTVFSGRFTGHQPVTEIKATLWDISEGYRNVALGTVKKQELVIDENGGFKLLLNPKKYGFYKLTYAVKGRPGSIDFFVRPNQDVFAKLSVSDAEVALDLTTGINEETKSLYNANHAVGPIIRNIYKGNKNPDSVKLELGQIKQLFAKVKADYKGKSPFVKEYLDLAAFFQYTSVLYDYPGFYKAQKKNKETTWVMQASYYDDGYDYKKYLNHEGVMLQLDAPIFWLDQYIKVNKKTADDTDKAKVLDDDLQSAYLLVSNQNLRDAYSFYKLKAYIKATKGISFNEETEKIVFNNLHKIKDTAYSNAILANLQKAKTMLAGAEGFKSALENTDGKPAFFKQYAGKYLYIDVWATWCGPCKRERPYLDELAARYKGKNISFVGVSIDNPNQKQKWLDMVKAETNNNIDQLFAGSASAFVKYYDITAIPRFLIFDREGKLLQYDAPRPSDTKVTVLLDRLLETKNN